MLAHSAEARLGVVGGAPLSIRVSKLAAPVGDDVARMAAAAAHGTVEHFADLGRGGMLREDLCGDHRPGIVVQRTDDPASSGGYRPRVRSLTM